MDSYPARIDRLQADLGRLPGAVVAFSGGVDSTMLLHVAVSVLRDRVMAITADSPSLPRAELAQAQQVAERIGVRHLIVATHELERAGYRANQPDRCYHCKVELFETIRTVCAAHDSEWPTMYGAIADDLTDHRPGARAAAEYRVLSPLADAGLSKEDVRRYSREHGLPTAEKPALACLASRIPYGTPVDATILRRLERAESVLQALGFTQFRVRHHDNVARIEVLQDQLAHALHVREAIVNGVRAAGYRYVALDLLGYRRGAMNEVLQ